jgi:hypothetical protein
MGSTTSTRSPIVVNIESDARRDSQSENGNDPVGRISRQTEDMDVTEDFAMDERRRNNPQVGNGAEGEMMESEGVIFDSGAVLGTAEGWSNSEVFSGNGNLSPVSPFRVL